MEPTSDDLFVVIVGDGDDEDVKIDTTDLTQFENIKIKEEVLDETTGVMGVEDIFHSVEMHGKFLDVDISQVIKEEPEDIEYLDPRLSDDDEDYVPNENDDSDGDDDNDDDDDIRIVRKHAPKGNLKTRQDGRRFTMLKPGEEKSFVHDLKDLYPEMKTDQKLLIESLAEIMRAVRAPEPPDNYYTKNGSNFECLECNKVTDTEPAASRHYQEYHGPRYLFCYACGVDFRSKTNLYKHEKACSAPDAVTVLKARAIFVGNKGRSRPFIHRVPVTYKKAATQERTAFSCHLCSAVFYSKPALLSHSYLHEGRRPYQCSMCPAAYTSYSALSRHFNKHTNVQFICDHCQRSFKLKTALVAHMDTHQPKKKHICEECGKGFSQKAGMLLHVHRVHRHLPPPCACPICPKRFRRMSLLKIHMMQAHGMHLMTRKMFFRSLPTMTNDQLDQAKIVFKDDVENCNEQFEMQSHFSSYKQNKEKIIVEDTEHSADSTEGHFQIEVTVDGRDSSECLYTEAIEDNDESMKEHLETEVKTDLSEELAQIEDTENKNKSKELIQYIEQARQEGVSGDIVKVVCIENGKLVELTAKNMHPYQNSKHTKDNKLKQAVQKQAISEAPKMKQAFENRAISEAPKLKQAFEKQAIPEAPKYVQQVGKSNLKVMTKGSQEFVIVEAKKPVISKNVQQIKTTKDKASSVKAVQIIGDNASSAKRVRITGDNASSAKTVQVIGDNASSAKRVRITGDNASSAKTVQIIEAKTQVPEGGQNTRQRSNIIYTNVRVNIPKGRKSNTTNTTPNKTENTKITKATEPKIPKRQRFFLRTVKKNDPPNATVEVEVVETASGKGKVIRRVSKPAQQKQSVDAESAIKRLGSGVTVTRKMDTKNEGILKRRAKMSEVLEENAFMGRLRKVRKGPSMPDL